MEFSSKYNWGDDCSQTKYLSFHLKKLGGGDETQSKQNKGNNKDQPMKEETEKQ